MYQVKVQIHHEEALPLHFIWHPLYDEIGEEYNLSDDEVKDFFTIQQQFVLPNKTFVTVFTVDFPELEVRDLDPREIFLSYLNSLQQEGRIISLLKINDELLKELAVKYYKEIIELEMDLRNVLTYILNFDNKQIGKELFKEFGIRPSESFNDDFIQQNHENGLFYILFNFYSSFTKPQKIKADKIAELLQDVSVQSFDSFKQKLASRAINEDRHLSFLFSINQKLAPIEKMRNSIMHIRNLSNSVIDNYNKAVNTYQSDKGINELIEEFWDNENAELKEKTWFEIAKSLIPRIVTLEEELSNGVIVYNADGNDMDFGLEEKYLGLEELKIDLIPYLQDEIVINNLETTTEEFELKIEELIDSLLGESEENTAIIIE